MTADNEKKPRARHVDRITFDADLLTQIDRGIAQAVSSRTGVKLTRRDFVTWRLKRHDEMLSTEELSELVELFYDEERFLRQALLELKKARARGEKITFEEIRTRTSSPLIRQKRERRKRGEGGLLPNTDMVASVIPLTGAEESEAEVVARDDSPAAV